MHPLVRQRIRNHLITSRRINAEERAAYRLRRLIESRRPKRKGTA